MASASGLLGRATCALAMGGLSKRTGGARDDFGGSIAWRAGHAAMDFRRAGAAFKNPSPDDPQGREGRGEAATQHARQHRRRARGRRDRISRRRRETPKLIRFWNLLAP